jgi:hypothetical protein
MLWDLFALAATDNPKTTQAFPAFFLAWVRHATPSCKASAARRLITSLAANLQPESQKLLWRLRATSVGRDFSQEDQKDILILL